MTKEENELLNELNLEIKDAEIEADEENDEAKHAETNSRILSNLLNASY